MVLSFFVVWLRNLKVDKLICKILERYLMLLLFMKSKNSFRMGVVFKFIFCIEVSFFSVLFFLIFKVLKVFC